MSASKRLPRAVREQQMLDAAVSVFARKGFHDAAMDDIAEAAAISKPMLYLYLGSKEDLFAACITREAERFLAAVFTAVDPDLPPREQLANGITSVFTFAAEHRDSWLVLYRRARLQQPFAAQVSQVHDGAAAAVSQLLQRSAWGNHPAAHFDSLAVALVGAAEALIDRMLDDPAADPVVTAELLVDFAWHGLGGRRRTESADRTEPAERTGAAAPR
ncbi:TetR/AcrR family transcriptional regulator [Rhodococcus sp. X156]|uniref:TetR/AcrR family transcriptional regulator n=1 Tax=Rhodococcus sp. X156 TaxID=2499145 RepID=UPI000FD73403|nr:TetR/AcrR family transcriptional regulator [Rhodococcus sp. X156]